MADDAQRLAAIRRRKERREAGREERLERQLRKQRKRSKEMQAHIGGLVENQELLLTAIEKQQRIINSLAARPDQN